MHQIPKEVGVENSFAFMNLANQEYLCSVFIGISMGVWKGEYGAYAYAPGVGLRMVSDLYCYGKIKTKRVGGKTKILPLNIQFCPFFFVYIT